MKPVRKDLLCKLMNNLTGREPERWKVYLFQTNAQYEGVIYREFPLSDNIENDSPNFIDDQKFTDAEALQWLADHVKSTETWLKQAKALLRSEDK